MNNTTLQVKFKQRLNKIDSQDYDNIQSWEIAEAFNKAQIEWCRRQLAGTNLRKEGDEMSKRRIDDLEILLTSINLNGFDVAYDDVFGYFEAQNFNTIYDPEQGGDYLEFKKIECKAQACFAHVPASSVQTLISPAVEEITETTTVVVQEGTPGQKEIIDWVEYPVTIPVFEFVSNGFQNPSQIEIVLTIPGEWGNVLGNWITYYSQALDTDAVVGSPGYTGEYNALTTDGLYVQEPWLWNSYVNSNFNYQVNSNELIVDSPEWQYGDNFSFTFVPEEGVAGMWEVPDFPNPDIILPIGASGGFAFAMPDGDFDEDCYILSNTCNSTAAELQAWDTETVANIINASPSGYIVGGPNNEYMWIENGVIQSAEMQYLTDQNGLPLDNYAYTGTSNYWNPNMGWYNMWGVIDNNPNWTGNNVGSVNYTATCVTTGNCWFAPIHVYMQTFDQTGNWVVIQEYEPPTPEITEEVTTIIQEGQDAVYDTHETPEVKCHCAPGADQENFCTNARTMTVYLSEVANTDVILRDELKNPSFEWCETFCTFQSRAGNLPALRIWRKDFYIMEPKLHYYRTPRRIEIAGSIDPYTGQAVAADVVPEFKDDIVEVIIDSAVSILAGDISDSNQMLRGTESSEKNN